MGKTQKRVQTLETDNAGKVLGSRNAAAARTGAGDMEAGIGAGGCDEQILPSDAAGYIQEMAIELKDIAESARLSFLAYLLDLVIEESGMQKRGRF